MLDQRLYDHYELYFIYLFFVRLYYAKIGIGTPPKDYYVQVDTGSDIMWVNCIQCKECPRRSSLGIELTLYDIKDSSTGKFVTCDQEFCHGVYGGPLTDCTANTSCPYLEIYGDGSSTTGYFVQDVVQYDKVSGDLQTTSTNGSLIFGCVVRLHFWMLSNSVAYLYVWYFCNSYLHKYFDFFFLFWGFFPVIKVL